MKPWRCCCIKTCFIDRVRLCFFFMWFCLRCRVLSTVQWFQLWILVLVFLKILFSLLPVFPLFVLLFLSLQFLSYFKGTVVMQLSVFSTSLLPSFLTSPVFCNPCLHVVRLTWLSLCQVFVSVSFTSVVLFYLFGSFIRFFPTRTKQLFFVTAHAYVEGHSATLYPTLHP